MPRQQMRGTIHQALERARLLLLAVGLLFCCVPTAHAIRCPTPGPALDSQPSRLNEEMPIPEPDSCYVFWAVDSEGRIGLFVGNNPISRVDPLGLFVNVENPIANPGGSRASDMFNHGVASQLTPRELLTPFISYAALAGAVTGIGALVDAYGGSILGWLGLGGVAAESPQGQKACQAAVDEGKAILDKLAELEEAEWQAFMNKQVAWGQVSATAPGSIARQAADQQLVKAILEHERATGALETARRALGD